jgi:hypothetical protein
MGMDFPDSPALEQGFRFDPASYVWKGAWWQRGVGVTDLPVITSLDPPALPIGGPNAILRVLGSNFIAQTTIIWDNAPVLTSFVSATELRCIIQPKIETAPRQVPVQALTGTLVSAATLQFDYTAAVLAITSLTPSTAVAGAPNHVVRAGGVLFTGTCELLFDGVAQTTTFVSATELSFVVPSSAEATARVAVVTVRDGATAGAGTRPFVFTAAVVPEITLLTPDTAVCMAPDLTIVVTGTNFRAQTQIRWDGVAVPTTLISPTQVSFVVQPSLEPIARSAEVTVQDSGMLGAGTLPFLFTPNPLAGIITSLDPNPMLIPASGSGTPTLRVLGTNFPSDGIIYINGAQKPTFIVTPGTELNCNHSNAGPPRSEPVQVRSPTVGNSNIVDLVHAVTPILPVITSLNPNPITVPGSGGIIITVLGTGFASGDVVYEAGVPAMTTSFISPTQMQAQVLSNNPPRTVPMFVRRTGVGDSNSVDFIRQ